MLGLFALFYLYLHPDSYSTGVNRHLNMLWHYFGLISTPFYKEIIMNLQRKEGSQGSGLASNYIVWLIYIDFFQFLLLWDRILLCDGKCTWSAFVSLTMVIYVHLYQVTLILTSSLVILTLIYVLVTFTMWAKTRSHIRRVCRLHNDFFLPYSSYVDYHWHLINNLYLCSTTVFTSWGSICRDHGA